MAVKITGLDEFTESTNCLVYADPGAGKTVLGGTSNGLIIALEPGTISAKRHGSKAKLAQIDNWPDFIDIMRQLRNGSLRPPWVVIDTLTRLQELCLLGILSERTGKVAEKMPDEVPAMQDYMVWQSRFKATVNALNDIKSNTLYLCHTMNDEDDDGNRVVLPMLTGKNGTPDPTTMSRWVCATVHMYGYLAVKATEDSEQRRLICRRFGPYFGKDRYGVIPPRGLIDPTIPKIDALIAGKVPATIAKES